MNKVLNAMYNVANKMKVEGTKIQVISNTEIKYKRNDIYMSVGEIVIDMSIKYDESKGMIYFICETDDTLRNKMTIDKLLNSFYDESVIVPELKNINNDIVYIVETQSGGSIIKAFDNSKDADIYYNENLRYNVIKYVLRPFEMNDKLYYYCIGSNVISVFDNRYNYITKLTINPNKDKYNIDTIKNKFIEELKIDYMPVF